MSQRIFHIGLVITLSILLAYPVFSLGADEQVIQIKSSNNPQSGDAISQQIVVPDGGAVSVGNTSGNTQIQSTDPSKPVRMLVRLKEQPLRPYLKQQRQRLSPAGKLSRAAGQQLAKSSQTRQQHLYKSQDQFVSELRKRKLVQQVHRRFTQLTNSLSISISPNNLDQIRQLPQVAEIYPDSPIKALLADSVPVTQAPALWAMHDSLGNPITGVGVKVAILDTGIDYTHPDLGGCIGSGCKVAGGYNFIEGEDPANPMDKHGHGTHVAGIVGAKGVLTGMAPDVSLFAYKVLTDSGWGTDSGIIAALEKATDPDGDPLTDDQMDIVNMSLGGMGAPDSPLSEAANNAMAEGVLVVVAAGNSGSSYSTIGSPGNAENVLTVGASDNLGAIADFSSRGPISGRAYVKPEVVAPGVDINSAKPGGSYVRLSGTSMATPHVAGAAALLKQFYPGLSAAELKTLLINSSKDLGQDLFAQGAGLIDLAKAASARVLVSPGLLSAGAVDMSVENWQTIVPVQIKNISQATLVVNVNAPDTLPVGATVLVNPEEITLDAGQSTAFSVSAAADTKALPYATGSTLYHQVVASVEVGDETLRLPLVFSKASRLQLEFDGAPWIVQIVNDDASYSSTQYFSSCTTPPENFGVDIKPGKYHVITTFYNQHCGIDALVFKENISLEQVASVKVEASAATHALAVGPFLDSSGNPLSLDTGTLNSYNIFWRLSDVNYGSGLFMGSAIRVSDISSRIQVEVSALFGMPDISPGVEGAYYLVNGFFDQGIDAPKNLSLDMRTAAGVDFKYEDLDVLEQGVTFTLGMAQLRSSFDFVAFGSYLTRSHTYTQPLSIKLYSNISTMEKGEWYPDMGVNRMSSDPSEWNVQLMRTGLIAFPDNASFTKLRGAFSTPDDTNYRSPDRELIIANSAYSMVPAFYYNDWSKELQVQNMSQPYWDTGNFSIQRDAQQNSFFDLMPYRLYCDGNLKTESNTTGANFNVPLGSEQCNLLALEFDQPTRFQGTASVSHLRFEIDRTPLQGQAFYPLKEFPEQLHLFNDGVASRILNGTDLEIQLDVRSMSGEVAVDAEIPLMEYQLGSAPWVALDLHREGNRYIAKLPLISGATKGSLRISIDNGKGVKLVQTLNEIFVLGQAAVAQVVRPPLFFPLPNLELEATGPLTHFELPAVKAMDEKEGEIIAVTTNIGPYSLGDHMIYWKAANSAGKKATAIQLLRVRDTTPPEIQVPPDVVVTATGEYTEVPDIGRATALDLVDGEIYAWTNDNGPYPVGKNTIYWNALDSSYNRGYRTQYVIVNPASSSSTSSSSSSSSQSLVSSSNAISSVPVTTVSSRPANPGGSSGSGGAGGGGGSSTWLLMMLAAFAFIRFTHANNR